ncbi:MAG: polymer-forming cytoskeletal protein [Candidatus Lindowbacteria bacterium]|nr:polymer-forming cytoskeletal protein [Candidatus Lindowbacteria bacterium]
MFKSKGPRNMGDSDKVDSVIGAGSIVKGDVQSRGTLRIDGNVEGKVTSDAAVIIGSKGVVKGNISASHVMVGGSVHGNVVGREKVEILSTGRLYGDVTTPAAKFVVAEGVIFEGRCAMSQTETTKPRPGKAQTHSAEDHEAVAARSGTT